jgi:hypothetical protein
MCAIQIVNSLKGEDVEEMLAAFLDLLAVVVSVSLLIVILIIVERATIRVRKMRYAIMEYANHALQTSLVATVMLNAVQAFAMPVVLEYANPNPAVRAMHFVPLMMIAVQTHV